MKQQLLPYRMGTPPAALRQARMDNLALVPASLLKSQKAKYQTIAKHLSTGGVLIYELPPVTR